MLAHGVLACLAFVIFFPFGAISIRLFSFPGLLWFHAIVQALAYLIYIAAFGLGIYLATQIRRVSKSMGCQFCSATDRNSSTMHTLLLELCCSFSSFSNLFSASSTTNFSRSIAVVLSGHTPIFGLDASSSLWVL